MVSKKVKRVSYSILAVIPSTCGSNVKHRQETLSPSPTSHLVIATKLQTGRNFVNLLKPMAIKLKSKWLNYGLEISVHEPSPERWNVLDSLEKKTYGYKERDESKRQTFLETLSGIDPKMIVYADESGMDSRDEYGYGWNERGERFHALKLGKRTGRVNMIAAYCDGELMAPFTIEGACNRTIFEAWIEVCLIPTLKAGQWLVIDNATFHKGGRIEELIEQAGCKVLYLPPYSPDLNKIEKCWSWLKSRIRHCLDTFDCLRDAMEHVLKLAS